METQGDKDECNEVVPIHSPRVVLKKIHLFKVLVLGEPGVGKSSFVSKYVKDAFSPERRPTLSVDFQQHHFEWDSQTEVILHFWDVPGQQRLQDQMKLSFRTTRAVFVLYDVTQPRTLSKARDWKKAADKFCTLFDRPYRPPAILLGNKIDLLVPKSEDFDSSVMDMV